MNAVSTLFKNHLKKDIDKNFIDALEAILFLSNATKEDFNELFSFQKDSNLPTEQIKNLQESYSSKWFSRDEDTDAKNLWQAYHDNQNENWDSQHDYNSIFKTVSSKNFMNNGTENTDFARHYNPTDMLLSKLVENLRRLYAATKERSRKLKKDSYANVYNTHNHATTNNEDNLIEQQKLIYQAFYMINDFIEFEPRNKLFEKSLMGQDFFTFPIELFAYIGMHEEIIPENRVKHLTILNAHIKNFRMSKEFIERMQRLIHPAEQNNLLTIIFNHTEPNMLCELACTTSHNYGLKHSWLLNITQYFTDPTNNAFHSLTDTHQKQLLYTIIENRILDSTHFSTYIENKQNFIHNLQICFPSDLFQECFNNLSSRISAQHIGSSFTIDFLIKNIKSLDDPYLLKNTIKNSEATFEQKKTIYQLYDFDNTKMLKQIINDLHNEFKKLNTTFHIEAFMETDEKVISKEILSHILSLDANYISVCKAYYLNIKFSEKIIEKNDTEQPVRRNKI